MAIQTRDNYQINQLELNMLNFIFQRIADRLDTLEGRKGSIQLFGDIDLNFNTITNMGDGSSSSDGVTLSQVRTHYPQFLQMGV